MTTPVEISDLVHRYCDAVVHKDREQWAATWAPDAHWDLGRGRAMDGREAIVEYWIGAMDTFDTVVQLAHNGQATIEFMEGVSRKLTTGSKFDVQFSDLNGQYAFGFAAFDNAQVRHAMHYDALQLRFAK